MEPRWYKQGAPLLREIEQSRPEPGEAWIWYLGQLCFVISRTVFLSRFGCFACPKNGRQVYLTARQNRRRGGFLVNRGV